MNELEVINFQSYLHSYLAFHPGINIIRGTSNHGKSAIVRAITWAITNQPRGTSFCNWNKTLKDGVEVHVSFNKGVVSRIVNNKFNGYKIFDNDTETEEELEALRNDVPNEILIVSDNMDASNIYNQDDGYFLLQDTPGNVARKLNERSGLGDIDTVAKVAKRLLDECTTKLKFYRIDLEKTEDEIETLSGYERFGNDIKAINDYLRRSTLVQEKADSLVSRIETLKVIHEKIEGFQHILSAREAVKEISELLDERLAIASSRFRLYSAIEDITNLHKRIDMFREETQLKPDIDEINRLIEKRNKVVENWKKILYLKRDIVRIKSHIEDFKYEITECVDQINDLKDTLDEIEVCPTCGARKEHWNI